MSLCLLAGYDKSLLKARSSGTFRKVIWILHMRGTQGDSGTKLNAFVFFIPITFTLQQYAWARNE